MSSVNPLPRLALMFGLILTLASCSFNYLYTPEVEEKISGTFIASIPDREGQILRNELRFLFEKHGTPKELAYTLEIKLRIHDKNIGIQRDSTTSRKEISAVAQIHLVDRKTRKVLYKSNVRAVNSYVIGRSLFYANPVTMHYAKKQTLELLAHLIKADLSTYFIKDEK